MNQLAVGPQGYIQLPRWVFFIRIAQGALSLLALALICYPAHVWGGSYYAGGTHSSLGFYIFACVWSFVVLAYIFLTPLKFPKFYHKYAHVALEFLAAVFWLSAFAYLASFTNAFSGWQSIYLKKRQLDDLNLDDILDDISRDLDNGVDSRRLPNYRGGTQAWWALCAVDSAVGAVIWLLWSATFGLCALEIYKQFKAGKETSAPAPVETSYAEPQQQQYAQPQQQV